MSRLTSFLILIVIWALIYLTNLGSSEFRSEEGHRVLPAVQMLDSGNQLVLYIAARPYLNKPPLINWTVAASFKLSGVRNEWTARLPSALFILAVVLTLATVGRISLGPIGSFIAALCWLTNLGLIEKGRMIEIEAIYCSLFAFALILFFLALPSRSPLQAWSREAAVAFHGEEVRSEDWLLNFPPRLGLSTSLGTTSPVYSIE